MTTQTPPPKKAPFCPHLTNGQIVNLGLVGMITPVGEAKVQSQSDLNAIGQGLKRPQSMGGLDLSALNKTLPVYQAQLGAQYKTPEGTKPDDPNPTFLPTAAMVSCQRQACAFWCLRHEECRQTCNRCKAEAFGLALQSVGKDSIQALALNAIQNAVALLKSTNEGPDAPEETTHDDSSPDA